MTEESDQLVSRFKNIGIILEKSFETLDKTEDITRYFEGDLVDSFNLTRDEADKQLHPGFSAIMKALQHVKTDLEEAQQQIFSLCTTVTGYENLSSTVILESFLQEVDDVNP